MVYFFQGDILEEIRKKEKETKDKKEIGGGSKSGRFYIVKKWNVDQTAG